MIQITVFSLLAIGASCFSLGFALCNVLYLVFSTSDGRAGRGKEKASGQERKSLDEGRESNQNTENSDH